MRDVVEMAREAGAVFPADGSYHKFEFEGSLERFAELVRADALAEQPAQRTWVGLTDEERTEIRREHYARTLPLMDAVEAKLKEKNT